MKKVIGFLAVGALVFGLVSAFGKKDKAGDVTTPQVPSGELSVDSIIAQNKGKIVIDSGGYWAVIEMNGMVRVPTEAEVPNFEHVTVDFPFWVTAAQTRPEVFIK